MESSHSALTSLLPNSRSLSLSLPLALPPSLSTLSHTAAIFHHWIQWHPVNSKQVLKRQRNAQYQKEYRQRQKEKKKLESSQRIPAVLSSAQHQQDIGQSHVHKTDKKNSEKCKRYRHRLQQKKLHDLLQTENSDLPIKKNKFENGGDEIEEITNNAKGYFKIPLDVRQQKSHQSISQDAFYEELYACPMPDSILHHEIDIPGDAQQQTLLWNEDKFLNIASGENKTPLSLLFDECAEELSFPNIYGGQFRSYREGINVTPFMQVTSELRRTDRRATDPQHLLYAAAKIMRLRISRCLSIAFKHVGRDTEFTKQVVQSEQFIHNCLENNLAFLRCIPNSAWYWSDRKKDLFAMIRQLGAPTAFMTLSANETGWTDLLKLLYKLKNGANISDKLIDELVSVSESQAPGNIEMQTHKHTFTCFEKTGPNKKGNCRFGAPFMPSRKTITLVPMKNTDPNFSETIFRQYKKHYKLLRVNLQNFDYKDFNEFYTHNNIDSDEHYNNIIRAGINRPRLFYKRTPSEKWNIPFNPFILHHLQSNMDFQIIQDEYACAAYVIDYVNKHNRGVSNLQRQIIGIIDEHPEFDIFDITKKMSIDVLHSVEMPVQEAAWYLLREPMTKSSVDMVYIPTISPNDRQKIRKSMKDLNALDDDCTDIWKDNWFDKYEKRPNELDDVTLAQFVAKYYINTYGKYTEREHPKIIRYRNYHMTENYDDYMREMVLLHVPFRSEENEILAENKFIQKYEDNKDLILQRRKRFECNLDIEKTLEIYKRLCGEHEEEEDVEIMRQVNVMFESATTWSRAAQFLCTDYVHAQYPHTIGTYTLTHLRARLGLTCPAPLPSLVLSHLFYLLR
ncbi:hypothetical protein EVAR_83127_1 [Eumeta japonica]|uniref:Uncharacterized protein n=1 Tax=Eumeta variegata TaxID=151549 RepID=A0A4C1YDT9_EUMVA|nr:hypothetical protein EVAR_83127_1 [Eumeta japonica]